MNASETKHPPVFWLFFACVALGIFLGTFWLFGGVFLLLGRNPDWWQVVVTLAPGAGIVFLVLMARHAPRPYGVGLMVLGLLPLLLVHFSHAWLLRLGFGLPLLLVGGGMLLWQRGAPPAGVGKAHE
jgi:hypothetical protein